jgi:hypothetical protein
MKNMIKDIRSRYPLIFRLSNQTGVSYNETNDNYHCVNSEDVKSMAEYINAIDAVKPLEKKD